MKGIETEKKKQDNYYLIILVERNIFGAKINDYLILRN
jgi:hypothetical protein